MAAPARLIVGLGNPGARYAGNRHNVGFMALDVLASRYRLPPFRARARFQGELAEGTVADHPVLALKPTTYVNESGRAIGRGRWGVATAGQRHSGDHRT